jgi:hypothetical protein
VPSIGFEGGHYTIKEIISNDNHSISFYVEIKVPVKTKLNTFEMKPVTGKIIMYFIDKDHMWIEIDFNDRKYPTDQLFPKSDFHGKSVIYWRGENAEGVIHRAE